MMFCIVGEMDWEKLWKSLWKGGLRWMKRQRWDLKGRKWEQVNVPQILFLSKQDVLWCFIYKATKAQKAGRERRAAKSTVCGAGRNERKRGGGTWGEKGMGGLGGAWGADDSVEKQKKKTWKLTKKITTSQLSCRTHRRRQSRCAVGLGGGKEKGVQCATAVVTTANAACCDVSLAAEPSSTPAG